MARLHAVAVVFALAAAVSASAELEHISLNELNFDPEGRALQESGSGSPPPPSPLSPPGAPGAPVIQQYSTVVTMVAAGTVEEYTQERRSGIKEALAFRANTTSDNVQLTITPGSVVIQSKIILTSAAAAESVEADLSVALATPTLATQFFATAPTGAVTVDVQSAPVVIKVEETVVVYPPLPPSPPIPMAASSDDGMDGGAIAGAVIGSLIGAALIVAGIMFALKGAGGGGGKDSSAGVMFTNVGANAQENV